MSDKTDSTHAGRWAKYQKAYTKDTQPCLARELAQSEIMRLGLHPDATVPLAIACPCPQCSPSCAVLP